MTRGWKVALGCGGAAVLVGITVVAVLGWRFALDIREGRENAALRARVAAVPFAPPADGRVPEDRLRVFLEVCHRTNAVELKHQKTRADLKQANESDTVDLNAIAGTIVLVQELQDERARACEALGMGMRELRWIRLRLGETAWGAADSPGGSMDDTINAGLFERYASEIARCVDLKEMHKDLDNYRRAIREGLP